MIHLKRKIKLTPRVQFKRQLLSIVMVIILGFLVGILSTNRLEKEVYTITKSTRPFVEIFIHTFTLNYWYFFILWVCGVLPLGFIISYFIGFFKSFMIGVTIGICIKSSGLFGIIQYVKFGILEIVILLPILIYASYKSISLSLNGRDQLFQNKENYWNVLVKITLGIILFSLLTCLKFNFMEASHG